MCGNTLDLFNLPRKIMDEILNDVTKDPVLHFLTPAVLAGVACLGPQEPKTPLGGTQVQDFDRRMWTVSSSCSSPLSSTPKGSRGPHLLSLWVWCSGIYPRFPVSLRILVKYLEIVCADTHKTIQVHA